MEEELDNILGMEDNDEVNTPFVQIINDIDRKGFLSSTS